MPLKKLLLKPGVNRENTRYTSEGGWYDCDKVRFRQGTPEKIGGWRRISSFTFLGVCRSLWDWTTLDRQNLMGVGTNIKFYIERGGAYFDVTPLRAVYTLTNPFQTTAGSPIVVVTDPNEGFIDGDYVSLSGATAVGGVVIQGEYEITYISDTTYSITLASPAAASATGGGTVSAQYQINVGPASVAPVSGWGASTWGTGAWGVGEIATDNVRLWSQCNFGEDLIFGYRGGPIYYWDNTIGVTSPAVTITIASPAVLNSTPVLENGTAISLTTNGVLPTGLTVGQTYYVVNSVGTQFNLALTPGGAAINTSGVQSGIHRISSRAVLLANVEGATDVPIKQNILTVSDTSRFVFAFGANDYGSTVFDPMLIRWSDQEDATNWTPAPTNQAGFLRLSSGSEIVAVQRSRQELLVWTDSALYSLQYVGAPIVWGVQTIGENISIASQNAVAYANGVSYWMGRDKFYKYDGRTQTLRCDVRQYVFNDLNSLQYAQVVAGTNEGFHEIWWFYAGVGSDDNNKYVVYNYAEDVWYYGTLGRTAWLDSGLRDYPLAATYSNNIVNHELGTDDATTQTAVPITAYITSAEFDLDDGHNFMFVWRVLPDITFRGSTAGNPSVTMYMLPLKNSGSGYLVNPGENQEHSVANTSFSPVTRVAQVPVEEFTEQIFTRVRGRQMAFKVESTGLGIAWQLGAPRLDMRPDGRR